MILNKQKRKLIRINGLCLFLVFFQLISATSVAGSDLSNILVIRETVKTVDSINIDIELMIPNRKGKFPVLFYVHGGGWDHGTAKVTPGPQNLSSASLLCDALGVVFVGVDYRCKNQNGDFDKALQDVQDVYAYALINAKRFKCDFNKVGFAGSSAGTPLSAVAAQKIQACKLYIGIYGKYDFINPNLGGYWPSQQTLEKFKIITTDEKKRASAVMQIRKNPPATLLIHGNADPTTGYKQSESFVQALKLKGGEAKTLILPGVKHSFFFKANKSDEYVVSNKAIMEFLILNFKLKNPNRDLVINRLTKLD